MVEPERTNLGTYRFYIVRSGNNLKTDSIMFNLTILDRDNLKSDFRNDYSDPISSSK